MQNKNNWLYNFSQVFVTLVALAYARPIEQHVSVNQSSAGTYELKIHTDSFSKAEERDVNGNVKGNYSYTDGFGKSHTIEYTAGPDGFIATGDLIPVAPVDSNLPVVETEEVANARALHLDILQQFSASS